MPTIRPFRGIYPSADFVEKVAVQVENLSLEQAKLIRQDNPFSYINMLVPKVNLLWGRGSKRELAFKMINENLEEFLEKKILIHDGEPSVYIYQVIAGGWVQKGIWTVTEIGDYLGNLIRRHELTREDREQSLVEYLRQTAIDANPVLITYRPVAAIDAIINRVTAQAAFLHFKDREKEYSLWRISQKGELSTLLQLFASIPASYIADGHHRAAAACSYGLARRNTNPLHNGTEEYNFFTSVYMSTDQLRLIAFHRLVKLNGTLNESVFLAQLTERFEVTKQPGNCPVIPAEARTFGMYFRGTWYRLRFTDTCGDTNPVSELDVSILQECLLAPVLHISDPRTDPGLQVAGGFTPVENLVEWVDKGDYTVVFTLFPTSIDQLIRVADAGEVMPPKSTWFEPKFPAGLLIHTVD